MKIGRCRALYALVLLSALCFMPLVGKAGFSFSDIHFWIGSGTNSAVVIIDWNSERPSSSLAWGVKWSGDAKVSDMVSLIAHEDRRFHALISMTRYGLSMDTFAYDLDGDGGFFDCSDGEISDPDDIMGRYSGTKYWSLCYTTNNVLRPSFDECRWTYSMTGVGETTLCDGKWYSIKNVDMMNGESTNPSMPMAAESPYAFEVVSFASGCVSSSFSDAAATLGRPSDYMDGDFGGVVNPANSPWFSGMLYTLSPIPTDEDGYVTVKFDHPVIDDPLNPFGLDFIVFGNAFQGLCSGYYSDMTDPSSIVFGSLFTAEPGLVEVSQDGDIWFSFNDGPFVDGFAPTLGHLYDTNSPDALLYSENKWWGMTTDATLPVDPSLSSADFIGKTLSEYALLYNGSAGGTGFDISGFDLKPDSAGHKWIQYVRVVGYDGIETEVDAFSDVSPDLPYDKWVRDNFKWTEVIDKTLTAKSTIASNGMANIYNAAFGVAPTNLAPESIFISEIMKSDGYVTLSVPGAINAFDSLRVFVSTNLSSGIWDSQLPMWNGQKDGSGIYTIQEEAEAAFFKILISE